MTSPIRQTAPAANLGTAQAPVHFAEAQSRMHDQLLYQCAIMRIVKEAHEKATFSKDEMDAMTVAYNTGVDYRDFARCVIMARELEREPVAL